MGHKISWQYKEYKGYPEATEISQARAKSKRLIEEVVFLVFLLVLIMAIINFGNNVLLSILLIVGLVVAFLIYMRISSKYDETTEKMIKKVIDSYSNDDNYRYGMSPEIADKEAQAEKKKKDAYQVLLRELDEKRKNGETLSADQFLEKIQDVDSMKEIWNIWQDYHFDESYGVVQDYIFDAKEVERMYGHQAVHVDEKKQEIKALLGR